jgi:preprotein translocase subunit SecA
MGLDETTPIDAKILSNSIEGAQSRIEANNFKRRKYVLAYDDVMNQQRTVIYKQRRDVLDGGEGIADTIKRMMLSSIRECVAVHTADENPAEWELDGLRSALGYICDENDFKYTEDEFKKLSRDDISSMLEERAMAKYNEKEQPFGKDTFMEVQRSILLRHVDMAWMEHIDSMDDLKGMINLQAYANRDPVTEYRIVSGDMFDAMVDEIREKTVRTILSVVPRAAQPIRRVQVANPISTGVADGKTKAARVTVRKTAAEKVGRNDPCPCGSGKKYKNCCGAAGKAAN